MRLKLLAVVSLTLYLGLYGQSNGQSTEGQEQPQDSPGVTWQQLVERHWNVFSLDTPKGIQAALSDPVSVPNANGECKSNACYPGGCASCQYARVLVPLDAHILQIHCYSTAGGDDHPISRVDCTRDTGWSIFDQPKVEVITDPRTKAPWAQQVTATFHNRSHNRIRLIAVEVYYQ